MHIAGIIAEYNPFHNGHQYQVQQTREQSGADCVVAVMSGNFVQRGQGAVVHKWARAEMAVCGGVDLVAELPTAFCCQSAQTFAQGGVALLEAMGCDTISFGGETDDLPLLQRAAHTLKTEPPPYKERLSHLLTQGESFATSRAKALDSPVLDTPNNLLAVEYLQAITRATPLVIKRTGSAHDGVGSASHIRQLLAQGQSVAHLVPPATLSILEREQAKGTMPLSAEGMDTMILATLRSMSAQQLATIRDVSEGLEYRIKQAACDATSVEQLLQLASTKRYPLARLRRIVHNALLGITAQSGGDTPQYVRVLAMNSKGMAFLRHAREHCPLPIIQKTAQADRCPMLDTDCRATDLYALAYPAQELRKGGLDFITSPVVIPNP